MITHIIEIMTEKQENIIQAAIKLFSERGYAATSTNAIAKEAAVSEGLIFRHFGNKEGLLHAIIKTGEEVLKQMLFPIVMENDPKLVIKRTIELPFDVKKEDYEFWKLQFKLKWELKEYSHEKMFPLINALTVAFKKLGYDNPQLEAQYLTIYIEAIGEAILKGYLNNGAEIKQFILNKYDL
ncbi:MAG: hypothetical protein SCALA702_20940 [Melioribacteraceae bacterium]|nr:MAG: hypothetical protein SCALA702_20940 [Melioribacteraceae bacterium]